MAADAEEISEELDVSLYYKVDSLLTEPIKFNLETFPNFA